MELTLIEYDKACEIYYLHFGRKVVTIYDGKGIKDLINSGAPYKERLTDED